MCHSATEAAGFRKLPRSVWRQQSTEKEREIGPDWEPATPRTLCGLGPETDLHSDWCRAGLWTTAWQDFSRPWVVCNNSKTERKEGGSASWCHCRTSNENTSKCPPKCHLFEVMSKVKKDLGEVSAGIGIKKEINYLIRFPVIWGQSRGGQLWPHLVQLGLMRDKKDRHQAVKTMKNKQRRHW